MHQHRARLIHIQAIAIRARNTTCFIHQPKHRFTEFRDPVYKDSIIPSGIGALGYTIQRPTEDRYLMTLEEFENKMAVLLGGRAAEVLVFDWLSPGLRTI